MRKLPLATARAAVDIRGVYGQSVLDLYEQMRRLLLQETGNQLVADFFAEPQVNPVRGEIAWYSDATGPIVVFADLPTDSQQALLQQVESIRAQIKAVGERYIAGGGHTAGTRADTFKAMLTITDPLRCLFSVGGRPVVSEWGCSLVAGEHRSVDLWIAGNARLPEGHDSTTGNDTWEAAPILPAQSSDTMLPAGTPDVPGPPVDKPDPAPQVQNSGPATEPKQVEPARQPIERTRPARSVASVPSTPFLPHDEGHGRHGIWSLMKYLILLLLAFLLIAVLLRGCGAISLGLDDQAINEEKHLRVQIASLREQIGHIAERCTPSGPIP